MKLRFPWLSKASSAQGRIGLAVGPDGWTVVSVSGDGDVEHCQLYSDIGDPQHFVETLVEQQQWQDRPCTIVLHPLYYQMLLVEAPPVPDDEMAAAVHWRIKELLDFPVDQAAVEFFHLPEDAYRGRKKMLYAVAMRKNSLQSLVAPIEAGGLAVDRVDIAELALHKQARLLPKGRGGTAVVHLLESEGFINLIEDGNIYLSRNLDVGLERLLGAADPSAVLDELLLEIQRSLDFYESQLGKGIIADLYFSPATDDMKAVEEHMAMLLGLNVQPFKVSVDLDEPLPANGALALAVAMADVEPAIEEEAISAAD